MASTIFKLAQTVAAFFLFVYGLWVGCHDHEWAEGCFCLVLSQMNYWRK